MQLSLVRPSPPVPAPSTWRRVLRWCAASPAVALLLAACGGSDPSPQAATAWQAAQCLARANDTPQQLQQCVTAERVQAHIQRLSDIASANGGSRDAGTPGDEASARYVIGLLRDAGYDVRVQRFSLEKYEFTGPTVLEQGAAGGAAIAHERVFQSGSGDVTAAASLPPGDARGCVAADFAGFPAGSVALVRRGVCEFKVKVSNAAQAGAAAVVILNTQDELLDPALGSDFREPVPVVAVSRTVGDQLTAQLPGLVLHVKVQARRRMADTLNIVADSRAGDPTRVVVAGAHLDTVPGTVGGNDNGSGVAALLETALQMARVQPRYKVRFAFWGAEEVALTGSTAYVDGLSAAERAGIALYLNFDMIASPNHLFGLYASNGEAPDGTVLPGGAGAAIQRVFTDYYDARGLPWRFLDDMAGRSDHDAFARAGIPHGVLFTGAEKLKTAQDAATWGGTVGVAFDPCYHSACDGPANVNQQVLGVNAGLVATAVLHFAMNGLEP
jgi:aminopeptidase Y